VLKYDVRTRRIDLLTFSISHPEAEECHSIFTTAGPGSLFNSKNTNRLSAILALQLPLLLQDPTNVQSRCASIDQGPQGFRSCLPRNEARVWIVE
jgi:hypothetical protein